MGTALAAILFFFALTWFRDGPKNGLVWIGLIVFTLGLIPLGAITSFHPYMLFALGQALVMMPAAPLGLVLMVFGRLSLGRS